MPPREAEGNDVEHVPMLEAIADINEDPVAENDENGGVAIEVVEDEERGALGRDPLRNKKKPIRMLNEDGTIYEMENNIVLPEGWGSDSDDE